jgi:hypothetical protein
MQSILDFHPVANVFPIMTEAELIELASDILAHCGQRKGMVRGSRSRSPGAQLIWQPPG